MSAVHDAAERVARAKAATNRALATVDQSRINLADALIEERSAEAEYTRVVEDVAHQVRQAARA